MEEMPADADHLRVVKGTCPMKPSSLGSRLLAGALACFHLAWSLPSFAAMTSGTDPGSIAIVSSVSGEAVVRHAEDPKTPNPASFKGPVVYGDRITTSKESTLGLLLGGKSLLTVLEQSSVEIKQAAPGVKLVEMVNGRVCLATAKPVLGGTERTVVRTPSATVTAQPGSLFQVDVQGGGAGAVQDMGPSPGREMDGGRAYRASLVAQAGPAGGPPVIETFTVMEGSIDIVSQAAGASATPVHVPAGRAVRVVNGKIGEPFEAPPVTCRVQDLQKTPVHTAVPGGTQDAINARETEQAEMLVAMVQKPPKPPGPLDEQMSVPGGLVLPTTRLYAFGGPDGTIPPPIFPGPGQPVLVFQNSVLQQSTPLVSVLDPPNSTAGPLTLFQLNNFNGNNANVPLSFVGPYIFNLSEYRNPGNPEILQASVQVRSSPGVPVTVDHGVSLVNSTITPITGYTGPVVQVEDSQVFTGTTGVPGVQGAPVTLVRVNNSRLTANDFLQMQGSNLNLNGTLLQAESGSTVTITGEFANVDPSNIVTNSSLLAVTSGSTVSSAGALIDLTGTSSIRSTLTATTTPIVNVNGGTLNLGAGLALLNNGAITTDAGLLAIAGGGVVNSTGTLVSLQGNSALTATGGTPLITQAGANSRLTLGGPILTLNNATQTATIAGDLLTVTGGQVNGPASGSLVTASAGAVNVGGNLVSVAPGGVLNLGSASLVSTSGSGAITVTGDLLNVAAGATVSNAGAAASPVFTIGAGSNVSPGGALLNLTGNGTLTLVSPLLDLAGGTTGASPAALVQIPNGSVSGNTTLVTVTSATTLNRPLLAVTGGVVTPSTGLTINAPLTTSATAPLFTITSGTLTTTGSLVAMNANLTLGNSILTQTGGAVNIGVDGVTMGSQTLTSAATPLFSLGGGTSAIQGSLVNVAGGTVNAGGALLAVTAGTSTLTGSVLTANAATVTTTGNLVDLSGTGGLAVGALITETGNSAVTVDGTLISAPTGTLTGNGTLVSLTNSSLTINGAGAAIGVASSLTINNGGLLTAAGSTLTKAGAGTLLASIGPGAAVASALVGVQGGATLTTGGTLINLSATNLAMPSASPLVAVAPGSRLVITGDLFALHNGGTLTNLGAAQSLFTASLTGSAAISGNVLTLDNVAFPARSAAIFFANDDPVANTNVTIGGAVASLVNSSTLTITNAGLLLIINSRNVGATLSLGSFADIQGGSTLTLGSHLATISNSIVTLTGTGPAVAVNGATLNVINPTVLASLVSLAAGSTLTAPHGLLSLTNGAAATFSGNIASVPAGNTLLSTDTLVSSSNSTLTTNGGAAVNVGTAASAGSDATLTITNGGLLNASGGSVNLTNGLTNMTGGNGAVGSGQAAGGAGLSAGLGLISLTNGVTMTNGSVILTGGSGGTGPNGTGGNGGNAVMSVGNTAVVPALMVSGGAIYSIVDDMVDLRGGDGASGGLAGGTGGSVAFESSGTVAVVSSSGAINNTDGTLLQMRAGDGGTGGVTGGRGGEVLALLRGGLLTVDAGSATIVGELARLQGGTGGDGGTGGIGGPGGQVALNIPTTAISLSNGSTVGGTNSLGIVLVGGAGGSSVRGAGGNGGSVTIDLTGGLLNARGSALSLGAPLIEMTGGAGGFGGNISSPGNGGDVGMDAEGTLVTLANGATFTGTGGVGIRIIGGTGGAYTSGGSGPSGIGGSVAISIGHGGLLAANGGSLTINGLLGEFRGGASGNSTAIASTGANALVAAEASLITLTNGVILNSGGISVLGGAGGVGDSGQTASGAGNLDVSGGGILTADGGKVTITGNLATVGGNLTATGTLVSLSNMTGPNPATFTGNLISISNPSATFCTTPPCSRAAGVLQATDAGTVANPITVGGSVLALDQALFEATAPLINLVRSALNAGNGITLANGASYRSNNAGTDVVRLDAGTINVTGALVNLAAGSSFSAAANLVSLANASTLSASTLVFLTGGSSFSLAGALVAFNGTGNTLNITGSCGGACPTLGNVPILLQGGATFANNTLNIPATYNPYSHAAGNTIPNNTRPLITINGTGNSVKLGP
jgi:hypothetical protein